MGVQKKFSPPLFDLLQHNPPRALTFKEYVASIRREVELMLNTRLTVGSVDFLKGFVAGQEEDLSDYHYVLPEFFGLADFSFFDPASTTKRSYLARMIERAITTFEPRIANPLVSLGEFDRTNQSLDLNIRATLKGASSDAFSFHIVLKTGGVSPQDS